MKKTKIIILSFLFMLTFSAQAKYDNTLDLLSKCSTSEKSSALEKFQEIHCLGYISGIMDGVQLIFGVKPESAFFCPPPQGISPDKLLTIIKKWVNNNTEFATESARMAILIAYVKEYPCN